MRSLHLPPPKRPRVVLALMALLALLALAIPGCKERPPRVPGETDRSVAEVTIEPAPGQEALALPHAALFERLGMRPASLILTERTHSTFREAEDRRRIEAFWQQRGYFDVVVSPAQTTFDPETGSARVRFQVLEGTRYRVGEVRIEAPSAREREVVAPLLPYGDGEQDVDLERFRQVRHAMADQLRRDGFGHANVYSRFYVDRARKVVDVRYFVDAGPETVIASVTVDGAVKVPPADVIARSGLEVGAPYTEDLRDRVVRDLLDTGAYAAAFVRVDTDTKFVAPGTAPDTGGELRDEQVGPAGELVPRVLPRGVHVTIHVVEAPSRTLRVRAGFEIDPARADTALGATLWLRNLLGPTNHLVLEGRVAYGWLFGSSSAEPAGPYGEALVRTVHPGALGRLGDLRVSARYESSLFPSAYLHRLTAGPGLRTTLAKGLFVDVDLLAAWSLAKGFGPFGAADRAALALPSRDDAYGPELAASIVWDERRDPIEPLGDHLLALFTRFSPGDPLGTHRSLELMPDARYVLPIGASAALALRGSGSWVLLADDAGVPLASRLFGGGSYGFRGFGRQLFSPEVTRCFEGMCGETAVGGTSLVESSVELRWLPPQSPIGAVAFVDGGGASGTANPFEEGPSLAAGLGGRLRLWYVPIAIDLGWRILDEAALVGIDDGPFNVFFRIGEAF